MVFARIQIQCRAFLLVPCRAGGVPVGTLSLHRPAAYAFADRCTCGHDTLCIFILLARSVAGPSLSVAALAEALRLALAGEFASVREAVATGRDDNDGVRLSEVTTARWGVIAAHAHIQTILVTATSALLPSGTGTRTVPEFGWDNSPESAQAERYMHHLRANVHLGTREIDWFRGDSSKDLLSLFCAPDIIPFALRGTCDAAVVTRAALRSCLVNLGVVAVWELKKVVNGQHLYQALAQVLCANIHCPECRPFGVLTDLKDYWLVIYMDKGVMYSVAPESRVEAVTFIEHLLEHRLSGQDSDGGGGAGEGGGEGAGGEGGGGTAGGPEGGANDPAGGGGRPATKRRRFTPGSGLGQGGARWDVAQDDVANLADLEGFLPEKLECRHAQLQQAAQRKLVELGKLAACWSGLMSGAAA